MNYSHWKSTNFDRWKKYGRNLAWTKVAELGIRPATIEKKVSMESIVRKMMDFAKELEQKQNKDGFQENIEILNQLSQTLNEYFTLPRMKFEWCRESEPPYIERQEAWYKTGSEVPACNLLFTSGISKTRALCLR